MLKGETCNAPKTEKGKKLGQSIGINTKNKKSARVIYFQHGY